MTTPPLFEITTDPINTQSVINKVIRRNAGAVNVFLGTVRELTHGKKTLHLVYEAYASMALKQLALIATEVKDTYPDIELAITHRVGKLEISEVAVVIAVSTPHRDDAFAASAYVMTRIKDIVPIWKKEHWEDGSQWIGNQKETKSYPNLRP